MQQPNHARKRALPFATASLIGLAVCSMFSMAAPACAFAAEKSFTVDGSMTITLQAAQQASASSTAKTGDAALYLILGLLAIAFAAFALIRASLRLSGTASGTKTGVYATSSSQTKLFAAAAIAGLVAALCFGQFVTNAAYAASELDGLTCSSKVTVNQNGEIVSNSLTVANDTATTYAVTAIQAPDSLSKWTASLPDKALEAGSGYSTEWSTQKLSDGLLQQLKDNDGELTLPMQVTASRDRYTYTVSFDTGVEGITVESQQVSEDGSAAYPVLDDHGDYEFAGWYTDKDCKQAFDFDTPITSDMTLYAKWSPKGYWMGAPCAEDPEASVTKTMSQIDADVAAIKNGDETVIAEYNGYLESDSMHLYTRWNGSTVDASGQAQEANKYVEFRILQVGDHDNEGCGITFQAAHVLTSCYVMNDKLDEGTKGIDDSGEEYTNYSTNTGGWAESKLRAEMQEGGSIYKSFDVAFTDKILSVSKKSSKGDGSSEQTSSQNKFWLPCFSEVTGVAIRDLICGEGSQYAFYKAQGVTYTPREQREDGSSKPAVGYECLKLQTRAYNNASGVEDKMCWWLRSPMLTTGAWSGSFSEVHSKEGTTAHGTTSDSCLGVSPAFCF